MHRLTRLTLAAALLLAGGFSGRALAEGAAGATLLGVEQGSSKISYKIVHKFHTVVGTSKQVQGKAAIKPDGTVLVQMIAPVASFDSENSGRDEHMQETMEATKYPTVGFKGTTKVSLPTSFPTTLDVTVNGELDFHGRRKAESIPVKVTFNSPTDIHVVSNFNVSLDKYEVDRPSLMLIKIDDACQIAMDMVLKKL